MPRITIFLFPAYFRKAQSLLSFSLYRSL